MPLQVFQLPEKPLRPDPICRGSLSQWHEMALGNGTRSLRARDQAVHQQTELGVFQRRATEERGEVKSRQENAVDRGQLGVRQRAATDLLV